MEYPTSDMNSHFNKRLNELLMGKNQNTQILTKASYLIMIGKVKEAKMKKSSKLPEDYQRLRRYDIISTENIERLIVPVKQGDSSIKYYVHTEEIFQILHDTHISIGHGGRNCMEKKINNKYKNITREMIVLYLNLCDICQKKDNVPKKSTIEKPINSNEINSRYQDDLIDTQSQTDRENRLRLSMWERDTTLNLIALYEAHPELYDTQHINYPIRAIRNRIFNQICNEMKKLVPNITVHDIKTKLKTLRSQYWAHKQNISRVKSNGHSTDDSYIPKLWCFRQLSFLDKHIISKNPVPSSEKVQDERHETPVQEFLNESIEFVDSIKIEPTDNDYNVMLINDETVLNSHIDDLETSIQESSPTKKTKLNTDDVTSETNETINFENNQTANTESVTSGSSEDIIGRFISSELSQITDKEIYIETKLNILRVLMEGIEKQSLKHNTT